MNTCRRAGSPSGISAGAPLFVFDPDDASNRPLPGDPGLTWWPLYPQFLRDVFVRHLHGGIERRLPVREGHRGVWRRALIRLWESVSGCVCGASVFWDPDTRGKRCWHCGAVPPDPQLLEIPGHLVALTEGATLSSGHLQRDRDYDAVRAVVEPHPARSGELLLHNHSGTAWTVELPGEGTRQVLPGQRIGIRPLRVNFGAVRGIIRSPVPGSPPPLPPPQLP